MSLDRAESENGNPDQKGIAPVKLNDISGVGIKGDPISLAAKCRVCTDFCQLLSAVEAALKLPENKRALGFQDVQRNIGFKRCPNSSRYSALLDAGSTLQ